MNFENAYLKPSELLNFKEFDNYETDADTVHFRPSDDYFRIPQTNRFYNLFYRYDKEKFVSEFENILNNQAINTEENKIPMLLNFLHMPSYLFKSIGINFLMVFMTRHDLVYDLDYMISFAINGKPDENYDFIIKCRNQEDVDKKVLPVLQMFSEFTTVIDKDEVKYALERSDINLKHLKNTIQETDNYLTNLLNQKIHLIENQKFLNNFL